MSEWQDISTAPLDGTEVLVSIFRWNDPNEGRAYAIASCDGDKWFSDADVLHPPTHWMPLPAPPKQD